MPSTRIRPAGAALLAAASVLLCAPGRADDPTAPKADAGQARKEFEARLAGRSAAELLPFIEKLAAEWPGHKGAVDVAVARLTARAGDAAKARRQADEAKAPPGGPLALQPDDAAVKAEQARADFLAARVRNLEAARTALAAATAAGAEFDRAAAVADEHLFRLRAAAGAMKAGAADLPDAATPKQLDAAAGQLATRVGEAKRLTDGLKGDGTALEKELTDARAAAAAAVARVEAVKGSQADAAAARRYETQVRLMSPAQLGDEAARLRKLIAEKATAAEGDARDFATAVTAAGEARAALAAVHEPTAPAGASALDAGATVDQVAAKLTAVQQHLAARLRAADERAEKAQALAAALDELERKSVAFATTLDDARRGAAQLGTLAADVGRRVAAGDLDPVAAPDAGLPTDPAKLAADADRVAKALAAARPERDALRAPDADADTVRVLTSQLLARASERLALLGEFRKLAAESAAQYRDRPDAERKRIDQRALDRLTREAGEWDWALAFDRSAGAGGALELLTADYRELVEAEERADTLKRQQEALDALIQSTKREAADATQLRTVLSRRSDAGAKAWGAWLDERLGGGGLRAEAGVYQGEASRLGAVAAAGAKRVESLTGSPAPSDPTKAAEQAKLAASGGEIGRARTELRGARVRGLAVTGAKVGAVLLLALLLPPFLLAALRRSLRGGTDAAGNPSPVLGPLRRSLKLFTWALAGVLVLAILGYDVTAPVIALAVGAVAVALAARPVIADVLGSVAIFAERRFQVGDVVRVGGGEAARVVGITWRSTALKSPSGLVVAVPNRTVTESTVENLTKGSESYDTLAVTVSTDKDAGKVINVIRGAVGQCKNVSADNGVTVVRYVQKGNVKVVEYRFWWFLKDYEQRNKTRDEVFARIALGLAHEDMTGIEVTLG